MEEAEARPALNGQQHTYERLGWERDLLLCLEASLKVTNLELEAKLKDSASKLTEALASLQMPEQHHIFPTGSG